MCPYDTDTSTFLPNLKFSDGWMDGQTDEQRQILMSLLEWMFKKHTFYQEKV